MIQSSSATDIHTSKNTTITRRAPCNILSSMYCSWIAEIEVAPCASIKVPTTITIPQNTKSQRKHYANAHSYSLQAGVDNYTALLKFFTRVLS